MQKFKKKIYFKKILVKNIDNFVQKEFLLYNKNFCNMYINYYKHGCWHYKKIYASKRK
jgi:hypothetical protein